MTDRFTGWLYENGIGENRAALIKNDELVQMRIEREAVGLRKGAIAEARFLKQWVAGKSGIVEFSNGLEALLQPLPKGLTEGGSVRVEIIRESVREQRGQFKRAKAKPATSDTELSDGPTLWEEIKLSEQPVFEVHAHGVDRFSEYGWYEALEQAETGRIDFDGGNLLIVPTPAMTVIDVDGPLVPFELAKRAAREIAIALSRLDITGNVGVDFPTLEAKADRNVVAQIFDDRMMGDCERTAINGFGFMQIVSRKFRSSILDIVQENRTINAALQLLRVAERDRGMSAMQLTVHPAVANHLKPDWIAELEKRTGRPVSIKKIGNLPLNGGSVGAV